MEMPARDADPHHHGIAYSGKFSGSTMLFCLFFFDTLGAGWHAAAYRERSRLLFLEI